MALNPNALTDAASVAARLRLAPGTDAALVEQLINEASAEIQRVANRKFFFDPAIEERLPAKGGPILILARAPVVSVASVSQEGVLIDPDSYEVDNAEIGTLYRALSWPWSALFRSGINFTWEQQPGTEKKNVVAVYAGGYVTGVQVAAANAGGWPGAAASVAYGKLVRPAAQSSQVWECTTAGATGGSEPAWPDAPVQGQELADGAAAWTFTGIVPALGRGRTLPADLERACVIACVAAYRGDSRDKNITSETVGRASRSYAGSSLPAEAMEIVMRYARAV